MAYCQYCGASLDGSPNFCPSCGASLNGNTQNNNANTQAQSNNQWSTAKTVGTVAGAAVGVSLLSRLFRPRPPHHPPMGPHHGPHGGFGGPRGGFGGPGPRGGFGGPGGHGPGGRR